MKARTTIFTALIVILLLLAGTSIVLTGCTSTPASESVSMDNKERPVLEFEGFTRMVISGVNTKSELGARGILEPEELTIPISVKRFDLVTLNATDLRNQVRKGSISLRIKGNSYDAELKRMECDIQSVDNGIHSYRGTLKGVNDRRIALTISSRVVIAEVTIGDESIWVKPVEPRKRVTDGKPGLHIVYSSKDTELPTRRGKIDNSPVRFSSQTTAEERSLEVTTSGSTTPIELAWSGDLHDLYRRYNVTEDDVIFVTNRLPYYLNRTILDNYTVVIATETGEPLCDLKEGEDCEIAICTEELCMIWAQGKSLSTENLMQHREVLTDAFFNRFGGKISNRYVGMSKDRKMSEDTKVAAYGFRMFPNGVTKEYRGHCSRDSSGYKEAMNKADGWFSTLDEETCDEEVLLSIQHWSLLNTYTDDYTYPPYGDYGTTTDWYWDDAETDNDKDYFMLKSTCSMVPGCQQYGTHWRNRCGYIHHDWKYYSDPGTRDLLDSQPRDGRVKTNTVSITLSGISVTPCHELDDQSDYIHGVAKWEDRIKSYSLTGGGSTLTVKPGSVMHCSQNEARTGEWIGLAFFESKPEWTNLGLTNFFETYTPGYQGHSNVVAWRLSAVDLAAAATLATDRTIYVPTPLR